MVWHILKSPQAHLSMRWKTDNIKTILINLATPIKKICNSKINIDKFKMKIKM